MNFKCNSSKGNFSLKIITLASLLLFPSCLSDKRNGDRISSINIIDRNGMTETISEKERLESFQKTDFLSAQPYQKVMRVYGREAGGDVRSCITSYHPNGQVKQYLEATNNRAFGKYLEWHQNGKPKIESRVIGGIADLGTQAEESWLFDGTNKAWDIDGNLVAEISYEKGELVGDSKYYHPNGKIWKLATYEKNVPHGTAQTFLADGTLFQKVEYHQGEKEGLSVRYWDPEHIAYEELFEKGLLMEGKYIDRHGNLQSEIHAGAGFRSIFGRMSLQELQEYKGGIQEGLVQLFESSGKLLSTHTIKQGEKEGEEISYYPSGEPKLSMMWKEGRLHGAVKTWYEDGTPESQREMSMNHKNGHFTSWYRNGSLMFVEEYDHDKLVKGEYYRVGEKMPLSRIEKGKGIATLFDADGNLSRKVLYQEGRPFE